MIWEVLRTVAALAAIGIHELERDRSPRIEVLIAREVAFWLLVRRVKLRIPLARKVLTISRASVEPILQRVQLELDEGSGPRCRLIARYDAPPGAPEPDEPEPEVAHLPVLPSSFVDECPADGACPHMHCRYHLGDVRSEHTCAIDVADQGEHTLDEVGVLLGGISRERVRQIEAKALAKCRALGIDIEAPPERQPTFAERAELAAPGHVGLSLMGREEHWRR